MHIPYLRITLAMLTTGLVPVLAMNNADVIKMKTAGLSDETISLSINKEPAEYDTSPSALVDLKNAGVSEAIIQKIVSTKPNGPAGPRPLPPSPAEAAAQAAPANGDVTSNAIAQVANSAGWFTQDFPSIAPPIVEPVVGQDYFTRFTLHQEGHEYPTTNYARGDLIPINTPVKLISKQGKKLVLKRLDTSEDLTVENVEKYSKKSVGEIARLLLSSEKTPLDRLPAEMVSSIVSGEPRKGMTKEQVLMARGYPPAHETPSLEADHWVFWSSRFVRQTLVFSNGRLVDGRGIY